MELTHATVAPTYRVGIYEGHRLVGIERCHDATQADAMIERASRLGYEGRLIDDGPPGLAPNAAAHESGRGELM